jgi:hypothetical protein
MTDEGREELERQRWVLMAGLGPEAVLYRDVRLILSDGVLTQRTVKGDLITDSDGLRFIPRSQAETTSLAEVLLWFLGPVGHLVEMILLRWRERDRSMHRSTDAGPGDAVRGEIPEVFIPYESIQYLRKRFGTLYIVMPRGIYGFSGPVPSVADIRAQVAARVGAGHLQ